MKLTIDLKKVRFQYEKSDPKGQSIYENIFSFWYKDVIHDYQILYEVKSIDILNPITGSTVVFKYFRENFNAWDKECIEFENSNGLLCKVFLDFKSIDWSPKNYIWK